MKKICVITSARSEYGLLRWLMEEIRDDKNLKLQLIVAGSHLSGEFGFTYKEIEKDGFKIDEKIEFLISSDTKIGIAKSMGVCGISITDAFERLNPDIIVVLGDRYELLPICSTALVMNVPIAHISGGDVTEGAIDDQVRNAITQMATIHFPGTKKSAKRIIGMGVNSKMVFAVGEPGLDNFNRLPKLKKNQIAKELGLNINKKWVLLTYHPETKISLKDNLEVVGNIVLALLNMVEIQIIITKANADYGSIQINKFLLNISERHNNFFLVDSLGQKNYINIMRYCWFMIGNSSSGIVEAPSLRLKVVNIGNRQKGRLISKNVVNAKGDYNSIIRALKKIMTLDFDKRIKNIENIYGEGNTSVKIKNILRIFPKI